LAVFSALLSAQDIGVMLQGFNGRVPGANGTVGDQHVRDVNALSAYWARPGAFRGGNRMHLDRSLTYLGALQPFALRNPALAVALASAYRQMGTVQEPYYRDAALSSYTSSALLYSRLAGGNPAMRGDLVWLSGRVNGLGGTLPFLMSYPLGGPPKAPEGLDAVKANATPLRVEGPPALVELAAGTQAPAELREEFVSVAATVRATHLAIQPVKESVASMGQPLHPDTLRDLSRMQTLTETAKAQIGEGKFDEAKENLGIASALAKRVRKQFGQ